MRKYGKYERMPDGTRAKQPEPKAILLQTYFTSLLCMVLCVTMFFGTTFAWFTSEVVSEGNEIYIGSLDVGLEKLENAKWVSLNPETGSDAKLFDGSTKWEPGYTALETIRITNEGELSFRYALTFANAAIQNRWGTTAKVTLADVAKHFTVYVYEGAIPAGEEPQSFADIEASAAVAPDKKEAGKNYWSAVRLGTNPATLADILERGLPLLSGNMEAVLPEKSDPAAAQPDYSAAANPTEQVWTIALHMDATEMPQGLLEEQVKALLEEEQAKLQADPSAIIKTEEELKTEVLTAWQSSINAMMGHSINMNVKLTAHQRAHEEDAFDSSYDLKAHVTNLGELDIQYTSGIGGTAAPMKLDAAYQFLPVESADEVQNVPYKNYVADFAVWADRDIKANSIALAGYYSLFCEGWNDGNWIAMTIDSDEIFKTSDINEKNPIRLVKDLYYPVTYELLCLFGNDGVGFLCGLAEREENGGVEAGTVITVELRLYEVAETGVGTGNYIETGNYIVAGNYTYTFE